MSHMSFTDGTKTVKVAGVERALIDSYWAGLAASVCRGVEESIQTYCIQSDVRALNREHFNTRHYVAMLHGDGQLTFDFKGEEHNPRHMALNTVMKFGNDVVRTLVLIAAQCEIHGYVEGANRAWLSNVLERARADNLLRPCAGWEGLIAFLRESAEKPVVASYSVCGTFPEVAKFDKSTRTWHLHADMWYPLVAARMDNPPWDDRGHDDWVEAFYDLFTKEEQWELALTYLRTGGYGNGLEWHPEQASEAYFGRGYSYYDLIADNWATRFGGASG